MSTTRYPYRIENGGGEVLTFDALDDGTQRLTGTAVVAPGAGPPMHVHYLQEEGFTVVSGRLGYQVEGGPPVFAGEGESVVFPAGVGHRFWNAGDTPLHCASWVQPAGNIEYFLGGLFASQREHGGRRPSLLDAAFLVRRYRHEYGFLAIPRAVQRALFPVLELVGRVTGRYTRFADAPAPMGGRSAA